MVILLYSASLSSGEVVLCHVRLCFGGPSPANQCSLCIVDALDPIECFFRRNCPEVEVALWCSNAKAIGIVLHRQDVGDGTAEQPHRTKHYNQALTTALLQQ